MRRVKYKKEREEQLRGTGNSVRGKVSFIIILLFHPSSTRSLASPVGPRGGSDFFSCKGWCQSFEFRTSSWWSVDANGEDRSSWCTCSCRPSSGNDMSISAISRVVWIGRIIAWRRSKHLADEKSSQEGKSEQSRIQLHLSAVNKGSFDWHRPPKYNCKCIFTTARSLIDCKHPLLDVRFVTRSWFLVGYWAHLFSLGPGKYLTTITTRTDEHSY